MDIQFFRARLSFSAIGETQSRKIPPPSFLPVQNSTVKLTETRGNDIFVPSIIEEHHFPPAGSKTWKCNRYPMLPNSNERRRNLPAELSSAKASKLDRRHAGGCIFGSTTGLFEPRSRRIAPYPETKRGEIRGRVAERDRLLRRTLVSPETCTKYSLFTVSDEFLPCFSRRDTATLIYSSSE